MKRDHLNKIPDGKHTCYEGPLNWLQLEANLKKWVWTQQQTNQKESIVVAQIRAQETAKQI